MNDREALVDGSFLTRGGKVLRITAHQMDIRQPGDKTFKWATTIEQQLEGAGWTPCAPKKIDIVVYVSGLTNNGITSGDTLIAIANNNGYFVAKIRVDNARIDYAVQVVKSVDWVIWKARIDWFMHLITW